MSSVRMVSTSDRFLRTKKAKQTLEDWKNRLVGRQIVKVAWDYRSDDTLAIQITTRHSRNQTLS